MKNVCGILETSRLNLEQTAIRLKISEHILDRLLEPKEKIELTLNPTLGDGKRTQVKAYIVKHRDSLGPAKGGIRMSSSVTMDDVQGGLRWK